MDIVCAMQKQEISRGNVAARASQRIFFGVSVLLFMASAVLTIRWCTGMSMGEMPMPGGWMMSMTWMRTCGQGWLDAAVSFLAMWAVMMVAMMLPSLTPVLWRYYQAVARVADDATGENIDLTRKHVYRTGRFDSVQRPESAAPVAERSRSVLFLSDAMKSRINNDQTSGTSGKVRPALPTVIVGLGYFSVWTVVGVIAYPSGVALTTAVMRSPTLASAVPLVSGLVVLLAGALQFTEWKANQLDCCRAAPCQLLPASFGNAWRYGLRLGFDCCCCCGGLTAILLVIGVMDLRSMAVVTMVITVERLSPTANVVRMVGVVVVTAGLLMFWRATTLA